jgi:hypothetical protein
MREALIKTFPEGYLHFEFCGLFSRVKKLVSTERFDLVSINWSIYGGVGTLPIIKELDALDFKGAVVFYSVNNVGVEDLRSKTVSGRPVYAFPELKSFSPKGWAEEILKLLS